MTVNDPAKADAFLRECLPRNCLDGSESGPPMFGRPFETASRSARSMNATAPVSASRLARRSPVEPRPAVPDSSPRTMSR